MTIRMIFFTNHLCWTLQRYAHKVALTRGAATKVKEDAPNDNAGKANHVVVWDRYGDGCLPVTVTIDGHGKNDAVNLEKGNGAKDVCGATGVATACAKNVGKTGGAPGGRPAKSPSDGVMALMAASKQHAERKRPDRMLDWIVDTGASYHLTAPRMIRGRTTPGRVRDAREIRVINTATGPVPLRHETDSWIPALGMDVLVKLIKNSPSALSLGRLVLDNGCAFTWLPG